VRHHPFNRFTGQTDIATVPWGITHSFLIFNVITMSTCSTLVIMRRYSEYAVAGLLAVVVVQALGYGLIFDLNFFLRNLSVMGGLLMVLGDSFVKKTRVFAGLPTIDEKDKKMYIQLGGRVLLIFLFIGFVFAGEWSFGRVLVSLIGLVACIMVVVGLKAKLSAIILVVLLSGFNLIVNNFWTASLIYIAFCEPITDWSLAAPTSPTQGLRKIRLLPDFVHYGWSSVAGQHGARLYQHRREEEGLLSPVKDRIGSAGQCNACAKSVQADMAEISSTNESSDSQVRSHSALQEVMQPDGAMQE
jgi:uncharacterized membrane protein YphA (DoxX/SURF4 family)